jgi:hypothetical protein
MRRWKRCIALAESLGTPYERARAHLEIGRHLPDAPERRRHLEEAVRLLGEQRAVRDLAVAQAALVA